ncbi:MAG: phytanoyl-CoA dioxygenase family protein [Hyphomicrobiaceae bacterium]
MTAAAGLFNDAATLAPEVDLLHLVQKQCDGGLAMSKVLTADEVSAYDRKGYHFPLPVLSPSEVAECRRQLETYEAKAGGPIKGDMRHKSHLLFPWIDDLIRHPKVLDAIEDVLGPNLLVWSTSFFIKEANDPGFVSWHQDATYWGLSSPDVCTAWIALSPANMVSGCMKFIAGTHKEQVAHADTFHKDNLLTRGQEIAVDVDESRAVYVELKPGQASLHHVLLFHGSEPNRSGDRRIGLAIRYVPTYVRQAVGASDAATLVRGVDTHNNFAAEPRPRFDLDPETVAYHRKVTEAQAKVLYRGTGKSNFQ